MLYDDPIISCLMVSKRKDFLLSAYENYKIQTYENKELILVYSGNKKDIPKKILSDPSVIVYIYPLEKTLGEARNKSIELANGKYVVQWDDDDINHPDRINYQYRWMRLNDSEITIFNQQYHKIGNKVYLEQRPIKDKNIHSGWPGTVMANKKLIENIYTHERIEEDTNGLIKIDSKIDVILMPSQKWYYMYVYHGENTWNLTHNMYMIEENGLREAQLTDNVADIYEHIDKFGIQTDYEIYIN